MGIMGILTGAFLPTLRGGQSKARDSAKVALLSDMVTAMEQQIDNGTAPPANVVAGTGDCLSYTAAPGSTLAGYLGRVPQSFSPAKTNLCAGNAIWYKKITATANSYIFGIELENAANANVKDAQTGTNVKAYNSVADVIAGTTTPPTDTNTTGFYYAVGK